jgi:hypothetical protein
VQADEDEVFMWMKVWAVVSLLLIIGIEIYQAGWGIGASAGDELGRRLLFGVMVIAVALVLATAIIGLLSVIFSKK